MPLLMSRKQSPEAESSSASFRSRSGASSSSSHRSNGGRSSQKANELRARYEMAQAIQKPWPLHLLENGVKPSTSAPTPPTSSSTHRSTASSSATRYTSSSSTRSSSSRRPRADQELTTLDVEPPSRKRGSAGSIEKLSLSPTLSNWIRRASKDSEKSVGSTDSNTSSSGRRDSSPPSSSGTSPLYSPKDL